MSIVVWLRRRIPLSLRRTYIVGLYCSDIYFLVTVSCVFLYHRRYRLSCCSHSSAALFISCLCYRLDLAYSIYVLCIINNNLCYRLVVLCQRFFDIGLYIRLYCCDIDDCTGDILCLFKRYYSHNNNNNSKITSIAPKRPGSQAQCASVPEG